MTDQACDVEVIFTEVTEEGQTYCEMSNQPPGPDPNGFELNGVYYDISTTATYTGPITVVVGYDDAGMTEAEEESLRLRHYESGVWQDVTVGVDTTDNKVTGEVTSLSLFGVFAPIEPERTFSGMWYIYALVFIAAVFIIYAADSPPSSVPL